MSALKCPGCKTVLGGWSTSDGFPYEGQSTHVHTPDRCRTASGVAALVDAARGVLSDWDRDSLPSDCAPAMDALRAALGALR